MTMMSRLMWWAIFFRFAIAKACNVRSKGGEPVNVMLLPMGVAYENGVWRCMSRYACAEWSFEGCSIISCQAWESCQDATFINNDAITCWAKDSCQYAVFTDSKEVACGYGHEDSCEEASIHVTGELLCYGDRACLSHKYVNVDSHGEIQCAQGKGDYVCGNMDIVVKHGHRACFGNSTGGGCAVICVSESDCDKDTITFTVQ